MEGKSGNSSELLLYFIASAVAPLAQRHLSAVI